MSPRLRLTLAVLAVLAVVAAGTTGYMVIERERGLSFLDAAYMTVITISTVGFTEVWNLSPVARVWTMCVIALGIGTVSVAFTSLIAVFVSGELRSLRERKKMESTIRNMRGHVVLCGYGRMGSLAAEEMSRRGVSVVVIEVAQEAEERLLDASLPYITGDATDEGILQRAGLAYAKALVASLPRDADNVYITLTAHTLRPELEIIARAEQPATEAKLKRAGATRVICTQAMGATRIANVLTRPNVVDLIEIANKGVDLEIDEYIVGAGSSLAGATLRGSAVRERTGASVVAIKRASGETVFNPGPEELLAAEDTLILVGPAGVSSRLDAI